MAGLMCEGLELGNIKLALDMEIATTCKLLEGGEIQLESGMHNMSNHTKVAAPVG
ncbi:type ii cytoskeletal [Lynx pardinus]|uniref:Type ii cytoskeletal n=1 Tax=Lynx pardinus TaxID=191816 RepID=A0A485NY39_LYNPA|nr:type ii cytoskeletal [Lynx pardinus]